MGILEGAIKYHPFVEANHARVAVPLVNTPLAKARTIGSGFWGSKVKYRGSIKVVPASYAPFEGKHGVVRCSFSSSSDGSGSMAGNFNESDGDYVNSSVIEAVEVKSGLDGFFIKMRDGRNLRCVHNNPQRGNLPDYAPRSAIVLKMEDGSDLLLPIIVLEMPSVLLMAAVRNVQIARPTVYQVVKDMVEKMGYEVQLVRVTRRIHEAYFAQLYLAKVDSKKEIISFDLRPSDAINIAVRCKVHSMLLSVIPFSSRTDYSVPIQVNRHVAYSDGMRVVEPPKTTVPSDGLLFQELDRPIGEPCLETKEFNLVRNMLIAVVEERYKDAGLIPDASCTRVDCKGPS
ncbi:bifunctional nuclease 2-like isoform X2 [Asparagus officinalis]|uniref:bifunctional nuclease 2-like isoform X2 n=1 Tax=Asparagus officinalis TaxID=4686 RepID=UPI00098E1447|nr:bifunctional nuclease 2-like isoform X2 [Asparagus officinalis]